MNIKAIYCQRHRHFKDTLVCALACPYSLKCPSFKGFLTEHRDEFAQRIDAYLAAHPGKFTKHFYLEVIHTMKEELFLALDHENKPSLLGRDDLIRMAEKGIKFLKIYRVSQEMELRYQLVPKKEGEDKEKTPRKAAAKPVNKVG